MRALLQIRGAQQAATPTNESSSVGPRPTLGDCLRLLMPVAHDWQVIGALLGLEHNSLKTIRYNNVEAKDCLQDMLHQWLVRVAPPPTWEALAEAVEHTDQTIACKIRRIS